MGIKELWPILQPFAERKPLYELEGKIVAIDLAGWVCESLCVVDYVVQPRFYLRNLFFRTCYLLLSGVTPVFVLEGDAPPLKYGVICKRNELQFRGAKPRNAKTQTDSSQSSQAIKKPDKGRSRFNYVLKQCEELIASMGLQCVQGPGEAEQFCAFLNEDKMVDGVISQDSDCFAYGARRVYRNFSVSTQGTAAAQGGAVDVYDIDNVQKSMDFGRNKMIVLALLCGCDYGPGVNGVGKDAALKLLNRFSENEILTRVKSWRSIHHKYTSLEIKVDDKSYCVNCGHLGRAQNHSKNGCGDCRMHRGCDATLWKEQRLSIKSELQIRKKAMEDQDFPSQKIIDEFFNRPVTLPKLDLNWKQPSVVKFLQFMSHLLQWDEIYCFQKFLPLLTRWQLFHYGSGSKSVPPNGNVTPDYIKKKRTPKGIASYEIIWKDAQKCFEGLIPEEQLKIFVEQNSTLDILWSTVEPVDLVQKAYPDLVSSYLDTISAKTKKSSKTSKAKSQAPIISDSNKVNEKPVKAKKKTKPKDDGKTKPIVEYFKKAKNLPNIATPKTKPDTQPLKDNPRTQSPKIETCSTPVRLIELSFDFNGTSDDIHDLSDIIQGIITTSPTITNICGKKLYYECADKQSEEIKSIPTKDDENSENNEKDETADEYDMIVAGMKLLSSGHITPTTSRKKTTKRPSQSISKPQTVNDGSPTTTPIIIKKFFKRNHIEHKTSALASSTPTLSPESPSALASSTPTLSSENLSGRNESFESIPSPKGNKEANVSYFFGDITEENDIFEKLTDFRNMNDESNEEDDAARQGDALQGINDSPQIELSETFDLDDYVPVGANLRKRIAS